MAVVESKEENERGRRASDSATNDRGRLVDLQLSSQYSRTVESLALALTSSFSFAANFPLGGKASLNEAKDFASTLAKDSDLWLFRLEKSIGGYILESDTLSESATRILDEILANAKQGGSKDSIRNEIKSRIGTHVVSSVTMGFSINIVVTTSKIDEKEVGSFSRDVAASLNIFGSGFSLASKSNETISKALSNHSARFDGRIIAGSIRDAKFKENGEVSVAQWAPDLTTAEGISEVRHCIQTGRAMCSPGVLAYAARPIIDFLPNKYSVLRDAINEQFGGDERWLRTYETLVVIASPGFAVSRFGKEGQLVPGNRTVTVAPGKTVYHVALPDDCQEIARMHKMTAYLVDPTIGGDAICWQPFSAGKIDNGTVEIKWGAVTDNVGIGGVLAKLVIVAQN